MGKKWRVIGGVSGFIVGGAIAASGMVSIPAGFVALMAGGALGLLIGALAFLLNKHRHLFFKHRQFAHNRNKSAQGVFFRTYSLRSMMIVVTLICVLLGGFMARANYLKHWADYHDREAERMVSDAAVEMDMTPQHVNEEATRPHLRRTTFWYIGKRRELANKYREAMFRPWMDVEEWPNQWPEPKLGK